jgi:hypothetical protein
MYEPNGHVHILTALAPKKKLTVSAEWTAASCLPNCNHSNDISESVAGFSGEMCKTELKIATK